MSNFAKCHACGRETHLHLLDAKPNDPANPEGCDWERLECFRCYGPGWLPCSEEHFKLIEDPDERRAAVTLAVFEI